MAGATGSPSTAWAPAIDRIRDRTSTATADRCSTIADGATRVRPTRYALRAAPSPCAPPAMLIDFFFTLRAAKLKVSVKEYLTLLEAIQAGVIDEGEEGPTIDRFYYL